MILVSPKPDVFRTATNFRNECGAYQLRAVLNAYGRDAKAGELYHSEAHRRRDWSLPWLMPRVLARYGITAHWRFSWRASFKNRALATLARDEPLLFVINSIRGDACLHWISVWGYDEATDEFLCYDSQAPAASGTIGNARYSTELLLGQLPYHGTFVLIIDR